MPAIAAACRRPPQLRQFAGRWPVAKENALAVTDSRGNLIQVHTPYPLPGCGVALGHTKQGARQQALWESGLRRQGQSWELVLAPDDREEVTGDLSYQDARRRLAAWRRERARQLLAENRVRR